MSAPNPLSLTIEEAVARMVSLDYLPEGFTVQGITSAFLEDAEEEHENARAGERESQAIRANVCEARHALAQALIAAMECELDRGDDSALASSEDSAGIKRVTTESLSQWASDQFGISAPEWEPWNQNPALEGIHWENVTIKIYADHRLGVFLDNGKSRRASFRDVGLMGRRKNEPNKLGGILIGLSEGKEFPPKKYIEAKDKTAVSKLRRSLVVLTGLAGAPFLPFNEADGWKPRFKLIDDRRNADERAKARARHGEYDDTQEYAASPDYEDEGDATADWLKDQKNN